MCLVLWVQRSFHSVRFAKCRHVGSNEQKIRAHVCIVGFFLAAMFIICVKILFENLSKSSKIHKFVPCKIFCRFVSSLLGRTSESGTNIAKHDFKTMIFIRKHSRVSFWAVRAQNGESRFTLPHQYRWREFRPFLSECEFQNRFFKQTFDKHFFRASKLVSTFLRKFLYVVLFMRERPWKTFWA